MISYEELLSLFITRPLEAISKSQQLICSVTDFNSYKEFYSYHLQHSHMSTCQREWSMPQMSLHCFDCANNPQSCVCLQCFLNGKHQGHDYIIRPDSAGNCDCGDLSLWKRSGFCAEHRGVEEDSHPEDYLDSKLRTVLTDIIFKSAFSSFTELKEDEDTKIVQIVQFISSFLRFGDGFRRLITISVTEKVDIRSIFYNIFERSSEFNQQVEQLFGGLVNDDVFRCRISQIVCQLLIDKIMPEDFELPIKKTKNYGIWDSFWFHSFSPRPIGYSISKLNWDWVSFTLQFSTLMKKNFELIGEVPLDHQAPSYFSEFTCNISGAGYAQTIEQTQKLFDELFTKVLNCGSIEGEPNDSIVVASFADTYQDEYYRTVYSFKCVFYYIMNCFKLKKDLKLDKLFEELDKSIDISPIFCVNNNVVGDSNENENDKFISKFLKEVDEESISDLRYYKSFHNGASIFYSHPLYDSLVNIFRTDNLNRVKTARILSLEKYQNLRVQLGIITLKNILSFVCLHQSLTSKYNHSLILFMQIFLKTTCLSNSVPFYLPLFQLLLGLKCNKTSAKDDDDDDDTEFSLKEFFAFEMAREIGLFDNFESREYEDEEIPPLQKQMIFSVLYLAILIVIERNLFNFSSANFIEEQIILALKSGVSQLDELSKSYDGEIDRHFRRTFIKIISKVATTDHNTNSNNNKNKDKVDSSFYLKNGIEWKTITSLNQFNKQKVVLENEISKNPNVLLKIPDFEPEEDYFFHPPKGYQENEESVNEYEIDSTGLSIQLKEFLFTPTILAVVYHTLRNGANSNNGQLELNDHLAMMVLVLVSRFVKEKGKKKESKHSFTESTTIQYDSTLVDLISKLKRSVFNMNLTNNNIENTLCDDISFDTFLKLKIGTSNLEPKSIIDLLLEKGEIGKNVLTQMSIDISKFGFKNASSQLTQAQINKKRANKLKEDIMNQYKSAISNYNFVVESDQLDENPSLSSAIGDVCCICSTTKSSEILSYSIYMYQTKIPFVFDKPPLIKYNPKFEYPVDDDIKDITFSRYELMEHTKNGEDGEEEEEEFNELPNLEDLLAHYLQPPRDESEYPAFFYQRQQIILLYQKLLVDHEEHKIKKEYKLKLKNYNEELENSEGYKNEKSDVERRITAGYNYVVQFAICQHPVHPDCVSEDEFTCPIDRSLRNGFLPAIDGIPKEKIFKDYESNHEIKQSSLTDEMTASVMNFIRKYVEFFQPSDLYVELIKSISGLISTYEIRLRSLPDCLDSIKTKLLSRNLFLTTWYAYRISGKQKMELYFDTNIDVESRLTTFQRFIKRLIECDDLVPSENNSNYNEHTKELFMGIVSSFVNSPSSSSSSDSLRKAKELYLFLKRVCLADYFLLNNNNLSKESEFSSLLDWDEILSVSNLSDYYKVNLDCLINAQDGSEFEFKPFLFTKMPKEFLHFALKPYNFKVEYTRQFVLFNLIDYNFLIKNHDDFDDAVVDDDGELNKNQRNVTVFKRGTSDLQTILITRYSRFVYPSVFLSIGQSSSEVVVISKKEMGSLKPFYFDRFGCEDHGYRRGMPLFLNEEKYERLIDEILSGDFSLYLSQ